jgi:hypothetical protein
VHGVVLGRWNFFPLSKILNHLDNSPFKLPRCSALLWTYVAVYEHSSLPFCLKIFFPFFSLQWVVVDAQQRQGLVSFQQKNNRSFDNYGDSLKNLNKQKNNRLFDNYCDNEICF